MDASKRLNYNAQSHSMETSTYFTQQFEEIYQGDPWYGKSLRRVLNGVTPEVAFTRIQENEHTIAELVAHMISWKQVLINRLGKNNEAKPKQKETFHTEAYGTSPGHAWKNLLQRLEDQHKQLLTALDETGGRLPKRMLYGVMHQDIYHLGQIAFLNKALTGSRFA